MRLAFALVLWMGLADAAPAGVCDGFRGMAYMGIDGTGTLRITSRTRVVCNGVYVHSSASEALGTVRCSDDRDGRFTFTTTADGTRGRGTVRLGDADCSFTFVFG